MLSNEIDDYVKDLLANCDSIMHVAITGSSRIANNDFSCRDVMQEHAMHPGGQFVDELVIERYFDAITLTHKF